MKRRPQTDEEQCRLSTLQSFRKDVKHYARRERRKGEMPATSAGGRERARERERERSEATRRERSYRMKADAAMTWPLYQYALWFCWGQNPGSGAAINGGRGRARPSARPGRWAWQGGLFSFAVAIAYN